MSKSAIMITAFAAIVCSGNLAMAGSCNFNAPPLVMSTNASVAAEGIMTMDYSCTFRYSTTRSVVEETIISSKPKHGILEVVSVNGAKYTPSKGYKGIDTYSIKYCGSYLGEKGCATYNYTTTVQ